MSAADISVEIEPAIAASDPLVSAWVSANAGSGKTYVLTNRVIRLLLDGAPPRPASVPHLYPCRRGRDARARLQDARAMDDAVGRGLGR